MKTIVVDLDGTICTQEATFERYNAELLPGALATLTDYRQAGYTIIIYTARSWSEYRLTTEWLRLKQVPYDELLMGKPVADLWIDDRAIRFEGWDKIHV